MLGMLGWAYFGGFLMYLVLSPLLALVWVFIAIVTALIEQVYGISLPTVRYGTFSLGAAIFLAVGFLLGSWLFLTQAEKAVADYDRTRHWHDEPRRPIRRRVYNAIPVQD